MCPMIHLIMIINYYYCATTVLVLTRFITIADTTLLVFSNELRADTLSENMLF